MPESSEGLRVVVAGDRAGAPYAHDLTGPVADHRRVGSLVQVGLDEEPPYPDIAFAAAQLVAGGYADRALLICHTGLGMAIAANKVRGVRAVTAHDPLSVEHAVTHNNAQVLCLGSGVIGLALARDLTGTWLDHTFDPAGRAAAKVALITAHEQPLASR
ncbi:RpiB/LacA/LacB family sugar-phosphate isomerase [Streptomyces tropicalis]|uniref:RpiB/LacA/LacB family sugar-phosphate isomerase n=1 Tax=Streptomyces tropicalis TaxID=3034234 RepID=A0ABT6AF89_9ACTN|nr:RpiB/LacA/LacB family sugar-phosphate isomerase [Streptomyces tropicalis]MDF3303313.1 RpiB/LacA/LacB family sugar-phosphate isomerase [Streptomyces tropicalis]